MRRLALLLVATAALLASAPAAVGKDARPCKVKGSKDYPGDTAAKAAIAQWMGYHATKAGLPPELPVMAALVESSLTNLASGDADSAGYFQMRASIWDSGPYAGFATNPQLQLQWFLDQASLVRSRRLAAGLPLDETAYGEWVADVIRPPEQYRFRYQLRLDDAGTLLCV